MEKKIIANKRLGEEYIQLEHPSGLTILMYPMKGYSSAYALFATNYGSIDISFKTGEETEYTQVPAGIAHYLEHKLFENEDCDAFERYAKTGANANAFTSFDKTAYLFSCSGNFKESLGILLDFVQKPYFTKETVEKEQGIIGQEIRMYDDNPGWRSLFNMLENIFHNHPVKTDIAGTVESIAKIDADLLYRCYNAFYNLHNMVLCVAGNFNPDEVLQVADEVLKPSKPVKLEVEQIQEPDYIVKPRVTQKLSVSMPIFAMGYKLQPEPPETLVLGQVLDAIILEAVVGETSPLYKKLYEEGLINSNFSSEVFAGRGYMVSIIEGESKDPDAVYKAIQSEISRVQQDGIEEQTFENIRRSFYGRYIKGFNDVEEIATSMVSAYFYGYSIFDFVETVASVTLEQVNGRLRQKYDNKKAVLSIIEPAEK